MGATRNTGYIENLIAYDGNNNIGVGGPVNVLYKVTIGGNTLISGNLNVTGTITFSSNVTANSFVKNGGVATEFLKADGTVDTSTYATVSYVDTSISNLIDAAPAALNTLNELAAALGDDSSFSTTVTTALGNRLRIDTDAQGLTSEQKANGRTNLGVVIGTDVQAYDADLGAIAALTGTSGLLKKTAANTWTLDTNTYITGGFIGTTALQTSSANQALTGITGITFVAQSTDTASITSTIDGTQTFFDFNLSDDNNNDEWRWRFTPSGASVYNAMRLVPVSNTASNLIVSGTISASNFSGSSSGTNTGDQDLSGYQPIDADLTAIAALSGTSGFLKKTAANTWSLDTNTYLTSYTETDTLATVTGRGASTSTAITISNKITANGTSFDAILLNGGGSGYNTNAVGIFNGNYPSADGTKYFAQYGGNWASPNNWGMGVRGANDKIIYISTASNGVIDVTDTGFNLQLGAYRVWHAGNLTNLNQLTNGPGYITGNQTITLTGDVTGSGTTSIATTVNAYFDQRVYTRADNYLGGYYVSGGTEKPNNTIFGGGKLKVAMLAGSNLGYGGPWNDVLWISTYTGGDVKSSHALVFDKYSTDVWVSDQNFDSATWGTGYKLLHSGNYTSYAASSSHTHSASDITSGVLSNARTTASSSNGTDTIVLRNASGYFDTEGIGINKYLYMGGYRIFTPGAISANGAQALRYEIARIGIDYNDWNQVGTFEVELHESYYAQGCKKVYNIWYGYVSNSGIRLVEQRGYGGSSNFRVAIGNEVVVSGDHRYLPVYVDVDYYSTVHVVIKTTRYITGNTNSAIGAAYIFTSPTSTNISSFNASLSETVEFTTNGLSSVPGDFTSGGNIRLTANGGGLYFSGGNNRIYFGGNRAIEGNGTNLQIGEGHSLTIIQSATLRIDGIIQLPGAGTNNRSEISVGSVPSWGVTGKTFMTDGVANYGVNNNGIILQCGYNDGGDVGGIKITDDGVIIWGAGDEDLFRIYNEDTNALALVINDSNNMTLNGSLTVNAGTGVVLTIAGGGDLQINAQVSGSNSILYNDYGTLNCTTAFTSAGDITAFSDIRLKENIELITNPIEKINKLRGVTFNRNDADDKKRRFAGVIAQEVIEVLPEVVNKEGDGYYSVAYGNMVGLLIEAIKEQQKQIEELKSQIKNK